MAGAMWLGRLSIFSASNWWLLLAVEITSNHHGPKARRTVGRWRGLSLQAMSQI